MKKVMFVASVGGHLTQLLQISELFNDYNYVLITEKTEVTIPLIKKYNTKFLKHISRDKKLIYFLGIFLNSVMSLIYFIKYNPDVIVTTGANTAAALCCLGKMFGKKVIYIESFAKRETPSITGKMIYKFNAYSVFIVQWENMLKFYPKAKYIGSIY